MKAEEMIIRRPDLLRPHQKYTAAGITLFFWAALVYLWQPALSLLAWGFNIKLFYSHMVVLGGYQTFLELLLIYLVVIVLLSGSLLLWAKINQWRFTGVQRRRGIDASDDALLCERFAVSAGDLVRWRSMRRLHVDIDEGGQVVAVRQAAGSES